MSQEPDQDMANSARQVLTSAAIQMVMLPRMQQHTSSTVAHLWWWWRWRYDCSSGDRAAFYEPEGSGPIWAAVTPSLLTNTTYLSGHVLTCSSTIIYVLLWIHKIFISSSSNNNSNSSCSSRSNSIRSISSQDLLCSDVSPWLLERINKVFS